MSVAPLTRKAAMVHGAVLGYLAPKLAADTKLDLTPIFQGVTAQNYKARRPALMEAIIKATTGKLAQDASPEALSTLLDALGSTNPMESKDAFPPGPAGGAAKPPMPGGGAGAPGAKPPMAPPKPPMPGGGAGASPKPPMGGGAPGADPGAGAAPTDGPEGDPVAKIKAFLQGKLQPQDMAQLEQMIAALGGGAHDDNEEDAGDTGMDDQLDPSGQTENEGWPAEDEPPPTEGAPNVGVGPTAKDKKMVTKGAMDAAIRAAADAAKKNAHDIREAENVVRPYVGQLNIAFDSAADVYRHALTALGVKSDDINELTALRTLVEVMPKPGGGGAKPRVAQDAATSKSFFDRFPDAKRVNLS